VRGDRLNDGEHREQEDHQPREAVDRRSADDRERAYRRGIVGRSAGNESRSKRPRSPAFCGAKVVAFRYAPASP
jgi:hypothetical protein